MLLIDELKVGPVLIMVIDVTGSFLLPSPTETQSDMRHVNSVTKQIHS